MHLDTAFHLHKVQESLDDACNTSILRLQNKNPFHPLQRTPSLKLWHKSCRAVRRCPSEHDRYLDTLKSDLLLALESPYLLLAATYGLLPDISRKTFRK